jgi:hypothetical protein
MFLKKYKLLFIGIIILTFTFFINYLLLKGNVFYDLSNYIIKYLSIFTNEYLGGDRNSLVIDGQYNFFVDDKVYYLMSSALIYSLAFMGILFDILLYIHPLIIFYLLTKTVCNEYHINLYQIYMQRQGRNKYIKKLIIKTLFTGLSITLIPRLLYLFFCIIFFPNGYTVFNFEYSNFIEEIFRYSFFTDNPFKFILLDIGIASLYAILISLLSLLVILRNSSNLMGYGIFLLLITVQTSGSILVKGLLNSAILSPWINGYSLFHQQNYIEMSNIIYIIIEYLIISVILLYLIIVTVRKKSYA